MMPVAAPVPVQDKKILQTEIYRAAANVILKQEEDILAQIGKIDAQPPLLYMRLADLMLDLTSHFIVIDKVTKVVLKSRNEETLNEARKSLYKSIIYTEKVVSGYVDAPFSDYKEMVMEIESISPADRYRFVRKMGCTVDLLKTSYGDNSKWRWTFVELEGRYAAVTKNLINLRDIIVNTNYESEHYEATTRHLMLAKKLLSQVADRYRQKYELSTNLIEDFNKGIFFLSALWRLCTVTDDQQEAVTAKKKVEIWNAKLASDTEKKEKPEKKKG